MSEAKFRKINNIVGWLLFSVAMITYGLTVEPTASYWDAGEYISTSAKLQVGHPPGAPFYQMMGAIFSLFAANNESIALAVNFLSVISSAFVILFLYWSTTLVLTKIFRKNKTAQTSSRINVFQRKLMQSTQKNEKNPKIIPKTFKKIINNNNQKYI